MFKEAYDSTVKATTISNVFMRIGIYQCNKDAIYPKTFTLVPCLQTEKIHHTRSWSHHSWISCFKSFLLVLYARKKREMMVLTAVTSGCIYIALAFPRKNTLSSIKTNTCKSVITFICNRLSYMHFAHLIFFFLGSVFYQIWATLYSCDQ